MKVHALIVPEVTEFPINPKEGQFVYKNNELCKFIMLIMIKKDISRINIIN